MKLQKETNTIQNKVADNFKDTYNYLNSFELTLVPDTDSLNRYRLETHSEDSELNKKIVCPTRSFTKDYKYLKNKDLVTMLKTLETEGYNVNKAYLRPTTITLSFNVDETPIDGIVPQLFFTIKRLGKAKCKIETCYRQIACNNQIPNLQQVEPINDVKLVNSENFIGYLKQHNVSQNVKQVSEYLKALNHTAYETDDALALLSNVFGIVKNDESSNAMKNRYNLMVTQYYNNALAMPGTLGGVLNGGTGYLKELSIMSSNEEKFKTYGMPSTSTYTKACKLLHEVSKRYNQLKVV